MASPERTSEVPLLPAGAGAPLSPPGWPSARGDPLDAAVAALPIGVVVIEVGGDGRPRLLACNAAYVRTVGGLPPPGTPLGEFPHRIFRPDRTTPVPHVEWPGPRAALTGETVVDAELHLLRSDGTWRVLSASANPIPQAAPDAPRRAVGVLLDITDRHAAQAAAQEARSALDAALSSTTDSVAVSDGEGNIIAFNDAFVTFHRFRRREDCPRRLADYGPLLEARRTDGGPEPLEQWPIARALRGETAVAEEFVLRRRDTGEEWTASYSFAPVRRDGQIVGTVLVGRDVTAQHRSERELRRREILYRTMAHNYPVGVIGLFDQDLRLLLHDGMRSVYSRHPWELLGKRPRDFASPAQADLLEAAFREALAGRAGGAELRVGDRTVIVTTHPVRDESGAINSGMVMTQDVTETQALHARLQVAGRLAALGTLVAGVGHEINNPLTSITAGIAALQETGRAALERLEAGERPPLDVLVRQRREELETLGDALEGALRISQIVKDLALLAGHGGTRYRTRLADVVASALRWLPAGTASSAAVTVEDHGAPDVMVVPGQLEQVVLNLLTNAVRAAKPGTRGEVRLQLGPGSPGMSRLEVTDRGVGMEESTLARIFDPFFTTRPVGAQRGAGLGLAISLAIVTAHGGTLVAHSTPGEGSTFTLELPAA